MKKITTKKLSDRIAQYGALTVAIAGVTDASGQIIYTDVNPDQTVTGSSFMLDLDGDTVVDFDIIARSDVPAVRVYNSQGNSILGIAGGSFNYPFALSSGAPISSAQATFTYDSINQTLNWAGCSYTSSQWCGGITDKFLGLKFNIGANVHYGWARLDIPADGSNFTIKDYAYNSVPGGAINAGDGILGIADNNFNNFTYFVDANNNLNLKAATTMENVQLTNMLGQQVFTQKLANSNEIVNISNLNTGIYLATVTIEGTNKTFKIAKK